jgi:hypothetical protein
MVQGHQLSDSKEMSQRGSRIPEIFVTVTIGFILGRRFLNNWRVHGLATPQLLR